MPIHLPPQIAEAVVQHARFSVPEEACGLLAFDDDTIRFVYALTNIERSTTRYTIDPNEHFRAIRHAERNGWTIGGVFHSHPKSPALPSATDVAKALDPNWLYVIVSLAGHPLIRAYRIRLGEYHEEALALDSPEEANATR